MVFICENLSASTLLSEFSQLKFSRQEKSTTCILIMMDLKCLMTQLKDVCQEKKLD